MKYWSMLTSRADAYAAHSTWKDFALVKMCLFAMGLLMGMSLPKAAKRWCACLASVAFVATWVVLMLRFLPYLTGEKE